MKKIIGFLLILFIFINNSYAQRLLIGYSKKVILKEMQFSDYKLVKQSKNYIEYNNLNKIIIYRFKNSYCIETSISMIKELEKDFIKIKEECDCWLELKDENNWVYKQIVGDKWVLIKKTDNVDFVTFTYYLY